MIKCVIKFLFNVILKNYGNKQQFKINPICHITGLRNKKNFTDEIYASTMYFGKIDLKLCCRKSFTALK